ncbi:MAG: DUF3566 domain-containing protein [Mycobacteriaceae bacterium]|nr:DUF3566 domain-containing protein [Mycobacteriaceae bacterium]
MTSPNEPGYPATGENVQGNGFTDAGGVHRASPGQADGIPVAGDTASHQRPPAGWTPPPPARPASDSRLPTQPAGIDSRLSRFVSGSATTNSPTAQIKAPGSGGESDLSALRAEGIKPEAYASELPDLSGPMPRSPQRKASLERGSEGLAPTNQRVSSLSDSPIQVSRRSRGPVRASMQIRRIDPWSLGKVSLLLSVALFFVWMIAVALLYLVLGGMGVWSKLNSNVGDLLNNTSGSAELVSSGTIFGGAFLIGLVNIVLFTAMATIGAFIYNLTTDLLGGVVVMLADRD